MAMASEMRPSRTRAPVADQYGWRCADTRRYDDYNEVMATTTQPCGCCGEPPMPEGKAAQGKRRRLQAPVRVASYPASWRTVVSRDTAIIL
jgi:hypothetical protein